MEKASEHERRRLIFGKLQESSLYQTYKRAFWDSTGLPLVMVFWDGEDEMYSAQGSANQNRFCQLLNCDNETCEQCMRENMALCADAAEKTRSIHCFAGLVETAVPVRCGRTTVAFLKTGHVFTEEPGEEQVEKTMEALRKMGSSRKRIAVLRKALKESIVVDARKYHGIITILTAFAMQLGDLANRIVLDEGEEEPAVVTKAKRYIMERLDEPLSLDAVAREVNVSSFYFCKLFKQATGLTFTEYVNRQRIEWAKKKLLERDARVTEVAYDVGYQSLSQFNRSFLRIVGESPTQYRQRMEAGLQPLVA